MLLLPLAMATLLIVYSYESAGIRSLRPLVEVILAVYVAFLGRFCGRVNAKQIPTMST